MIPSEPLPEEVEEAKLNPNGWIYRVADSFGDMAVPPEAIVGAWQVDANGKIIGDFQVNPRFRNPAPPLPEKLTPLHPDHLHH